MSKRFSLSNKGFAHPLLLLTIILLLATAGYFFVYKNGLLENYIPYFSSDVRNVGADPSVAQIKPYIFWWPKQATPWVYKGVLGGMKFMNYSRATDKPALTSEFNLMVSKSKPSLLVIKVDAEDMLPLRKLNGQPNAPLAEGNATLNQVVDGNLQNFEYYDDLVQLAKNNNIEVAFHLNFSAYGGSSPYPYSYYSKAGWFWKRPDWAGGIANPTTDAMRYAPAARNKSDYNWLEHETGYIVYPGANHRHMAFSSNGQEETGLGQWQVFESPDMVFSGFDTVLHNGELIIHTPIPSLSSQAYRDFVKNNMQKFATHYKNKDIKFYQIFEEPSYAHLRENVYYSNNWTPPNVGAGPGYYYDVDYSSVELARYNTWRASRGEGPVGEIPYRANANYNRFKKHNLADFLREIGTGVKAGDTGAKVLVGDFYDVGYSGAGSDLGSLISIVRPEILTREPPNFLHETFAQPKTLNDYLKQIRSYSTSIDQYFSFYNPVPANAKDAEVATIFGTYGFNTYYTPMILAVIGNANAEARYALWRAGGCPGCIFRYDNTNPPNNPTVPSPPPPNDTTLITVRAKGVVNNGSPQMQLLYKDSPQITWNVSNIMAEYSYKLSQSANPEDIKVKFINDNGPRDLVVDYMKIGTTVYQTEAPSTYSEGSWGPTNGCGGGYKQSESLACNGYFRYSGDSSPPPPPTPPPPPPGVSSVITIRARGVNNNGATQMRLLHKDVAKKTWNVTNNMANYTFTINENVVADDVKVAFINDNGPRDLVVDYMKIGSTVYQTESPSTYSEGSWGPTNGCGGGNKQSETLACTGFFRYSSSNAPVPPPPPVVSTVITIRARGVNWLGYPQMQLLYNDVVQKTWTVTNNMANYTFTINATVNPQDLKVKFINDNGRRDLVVDYMKIGDKIYQTEAPTTYSVGSWSPANNCGPGKKQSEVLHCNGYFLYSN